MTLARGAASQETTRAPCTTSANPPSAPSTNQHITTYLYHPSTMFVRSKRCVRVSTSTSKTIRISFQHMSTETTDELPEQDCLPVGQRHISSGPLALAKFMVGMFSDFERRRDPPSESKTQHARLITIRGSHYCEKGRWAMDLLEADKSSPVYYTEDPHPPGLHAFASIAASKDTGSRTPCVILDSPTKGEEPAFIADSTALLRRFVPSLYPVEVKGEIMEMEDLIGAKLGPSLRVYVYNSLLEPEYQKSVVKMMATDTTSIEYLLFDKMLSVGIAPAMRKQMKINDESAETSKAAIQEIFDMVSKRLEVNGGEYLMDDDDTNSMLGKKSYGFTAADLTFAALASPFTRPPERAIFNLEDDDVPPELLEFVVGLTQSVAGQHANKIYAKHRLSLSSDDDERVLSIKGVDRNAYPLFSFLKFW